MVVAILGAVAIEVIRERGHTNGDVALALLFYGGLAGGVLITGLAGQSASTLQTYLFGSVTSVSAADVLTTHGARGRRGGRCASGSPPSCSPSPRTRSSRGWPASRSAFYNLLVAVLAAVTVTVAMRTVGLLLVSALMVVPVATAQQLTRSFRGTLALAMALGLGAALGGLLLAAYLSLDFDANVAPGPSIVLLALTGFALTWPVGAWLRSREVARG